MSHSNRLLGKQPGLVARVKRLWPLLAALCALVLILTFLAGRQP